jgi:hypothetical protein
MASEGLNMIQLSPRSYVFNGLELLRQPLIEFIEKFLKSKNRYWWREYIYNKISTKRNGIPKSGNINDLYTKIDESLCLEIIIKNKNIFREIFSNDELNLINELKTIRNKCAHIFLVGGVISSSFADNALTMMAKLMHKLNDTVIEQKLYSLRIQMRKNNLYNKPVVASKETIVNFLNEKVLLKAKNDPRATNEILRKIERTYEELEKELPTNEDIVNWFNLLMNSPRGINSYTHFKNAGLTTFEDIREEFYKLCYGQENI